MYNILLVEDSPDFQLLISESLKKITRDFTTCSTYEEAKSLIQNEHFDAILLDVALSDSDGFSIYHELQSSPRTSKTPVFFITEKSQPSDIAAALTLGAEDVITKPFEPIVFTAKIESRLNKISATKTQDELLEIEDLLINLPNMKAYVKSEQSNQDLMLTPIEFKLLYLLARSEERVFSRDQILKSVWGENVNVFDRNVDVQLSSLRKKLGKYSKCIQAVPGAGYRFSRQRKNKAA